MKRKLNFLLFGLLGLTLSSFLFLSSCTEKVQSLPEILSVTLDPDTVEAGGITLIRTLAQDVDGDELVYSYTLNGGRISGYGDSVYWLAPLNGGLYNAIVRVTDPSGNQSIDSVKLVVINSGKTTLSGTASFPEGTNFDLSGSKMKLYTSLQERLAGHPCDSTIVFGFGSIVSFTFPAINAGTYYLDLWKDMDNSMTMSTGDFTGWYGSGDLSDPLLKPLPVVEGIPSQVQMEVHIVP